MSFPTERSLESSLDFTSNETETMEKRIHDAIQKCWFLTGATASGKSEIGLHLAERLDAEILSLDSMAIYQGMDIGTAKPSASAQAQVHHHLLDLVAPTDSFSVSEYRDKAHAVIDRLLASGKAVLFVGGTPLYLKSLLRGIFEGPPADWDFRNELEREIEQAGVKALHDRLALVDPLSAHKLHPNDKRRLIRALEVYRLTGQPISHLQTHFDEAIPQDQCRVFALHWERGKLHDRIDQRVDRMFEEGLVDEVKQLRETYGTLSRTASQAVGYREVLDYLEGESSTIEATIETVKSRTRQFARRQETWFRALSECRWIERNDEQSAEEVAEQLQAISAVSTSEPSS